jgi:hypothetical protein
MRTNLTLDDDVYEAALRISQSSGERLGKVVSRLMRFGLAAQRSRAQRFPMFVAPGTPMMALEAIDKFIDEEGLF